MNFLRKNMIKKSEKISLLKMIAVLGIISLTSCTMFNDSSKIQLDNHNNGKIIKAQIGDLIEIELKGNATTGYSWILQKYDEALLKFIDVKYYPDNTTRVGSGGAWIARFEVIKNGSSSIEFSYKRPWETEKEPIEKYLVTIRSDKK